MVEDVLYHVEKDKTLKIVPPICDRFKPFLEIHQGPYSGHLRETKMHGQLSKQYWWPRMRSGVAHWRRAGLTCATGSVVKPQLTPIPVGGPFDRVGVDVLQLPKIKRYAIVFIDYLTKWPEVYATPGQTTPTIARLFVEHIVTRHGVPNEMLISFLSKLMLSICELLGVKKN